MGNITRYEDFFALSAARALREVADDLRTGVLVHSDIHNFSDLHDFVDANEYGFLCNEEVAIDHNSAEDTFVINAIQSIVSTALVATVNATSKERISALEETARDLLAIYNPTAGSENTDPDDIANLARFVTSEA